MTPSFARMSQKFVGCRKTESKFELRIFVHICSESNCDTSRWNSFKCGMEMEIRSNGNSLKCGTFHTVKTWSDAKVSSGSWKMLQNEYLLVVTKSVSLFLFFRRIAWEVQSNKRNEKRKVNNAGRRPVCLYSNILKLKIKSRTHLLQWTVQLLVLCFDCRSLERWMILLHTN